MESDSDSSDQDSDSEDDTGRKRAHKERHDEKMREMITAAIRQEVAHGKNDSEDLIAEAVQQEAAKSANADNAPNLAEGNDLITIGEHLLDELIADIINKKYIKLSKLSSAESVRGEEEFQCTTSKVTRYTNRLKSLKKLITYSSTCVICSSTALDICITNPQFLQYLFNILEENRHFKFKPVMAYDESFRLHREQNPNFSWARVHEIHHTKLNKYHNV